MGTLVYKHGTVDNATELYTVIDSLLTTAFSSEEPRGFGWNEGYRTDSTNAIYYSYGSSGTDYIVYKMDVDVSDTYIDRYCGQTYNESDGTLVNSIGGTASERMTVSVINTKYWLIGNENFFYLATYNGTTYNHYYSGMINRFSGFGNSSLYGTTAPSPSDTTTPTSDFVISTATTLYLRNGTSDGYGGLSVVGNKTLVAGQNLIIVNTSNSSNVGNIGAVTVDSVDEILNTVTLTSTSGSTDFSSFARIGVDPQPICLNVGGVINGTNTFEFLNDSTCMTNIAFGVVDEPASGISAALQNPTARGMFVGYPLRVYNATEFRGSLFGIIAVPVDSQTSEDVFETYDAQYRFITFIDGTKYIAMGSIK